MNPRLLIAEDDRIMRLLIRGIVEDELDSSVSIVDVVDGSAAIEAIRQSVGNQFHTVLTDLQMPTKKGVKDQNGFDVAAVALDLMVPNVVMMTCTEFSEQVEMFGEKRIRALKDRGLVVFDKLDGIVKIQKYIIEPLLAGSQARVK